MRPFGIPLVWQPRPSAGSCTPLANETNGYSSLQEHVHTMILKSVVPTVSSLRGYWYTCLSNFLTRISFAYWSVAWASPSWAARMYASPELKALNASSEKLPLRSTARRRWWFSWRSLLQNLWQRAYPHLLSEDNIAPAPHRPPLLKPVLESGWWRLDWHDLRI